MTRQSLQVWNRSCIEAKWFPRGAWGTQNRRKSGPGSLLGPSRALKELPWMIQSVIDVPRDHPGSVPGVPGECSRATRSARKTVRERLGPTKFDSEVPPQAETARFCCTPRSHPVFESVFRHLLPNFVFFVKSANPPKYRACRQNQGFGHSLCESLRSRNVTSKKHEN